MLAMTDGAGDCRFARLNRSAATQGPSRRHEPVPLTATPVSTHFGLGTLLWIDPEREMFVVLLTNRVHDAKARRPAKVISDVRADLADAAALAVTDYADGPMLMPAKFRADRAVDWNRPERKVRKHVVRKSSKSSISSRKAKAASGKTTKPSTKAAAKPSAARATTSKARR